MEKNKTKFILVFWLCIYLLVIMEIDLFSQSFNPVTDSKGYMLRFFHIDPNVQLVDTLLRIKYGDTLVVSWHQPKSDDTTGIPLPFFYPHDDTVDLWIPNDSTLYKYLYTGNDSSIWATVHNVGLRPGYHELSVTCADLSFNISQYSEPFRFKVIKIPGQPYDVWIIVKRKLTLTK